jgi:AraC-like DNA-binding protein
VADISCRESHPGWSAEEPVGGPSVVLVRSGLFRRRVDGTESVVDAMTAYVERPGSVQRIAHPCGGDTCTVIEPAAAALGELFERGWDFPDEALPVPTDVDVDHRVLVARARQGAEGFELTERAAVLAGRLIGALSAELSRLAQAPNGARGRWLTDQVRQALAGNIELGLPELARRTGVSAFHLSRTFRSNTGMTLTRYRRRLRLKAALDRLEAGDSDLARLAADLGFADQAHLTRTMRAEASATPGQLRAHLGPSGK